MRIENRDLQYERLLIAEIGNNHEGDSQLALEMVAAAAEAGADGVKVQVLQPEHYVHASQTERIAQLSRFRLPHETFAAMAELARAKGLLFIATSFDVESLQRMNELVSAVKIASGDLDFIPLVVAAARSGKPIILSTGMATLSEVGAAVQTIGSHLPPGRTVATSLALLHCISAYPAPITEVNLKAIETLKSAFGLPVGYSDHTLGIEVALLATAFGARIIEKHFTLDKTRTTFRDHALSADPGELQRLATFLHSFDSILGDGEKRTMPCEQQNVVAVRRSAVAVRDVPAGVRLSLADLDFVRPRTGLSPAQALTFVGQQVRVPLKRHEFILESHLG